MADEVDLAQDQIEASLNNAIRAAARAPRLKADGHCHNCTAPIAYGLFCDALCREDYEREQEIIRKTHGRP